eukprot:9858449-Lingulodinium_polyedra.AAC.1
MLTSSGASSARTNFTARQRLTSNRSSAWTSGLISSVTLERVASMQALIFCRSARIVVSHCLCFCNASKIRSSRLNH